MKSFTYKALAVAAAAACGTTAFAGSQTVTQRNFALEAITNTTAITVPDVIVTIGVQRTIGQDFTVILKPTGANTKFNGTCPLPTATDAAGGVVTPSVKRGGVTECAYEIDVVNATVAANNLSLNFSGLVFANHSLATEGTTESIATNVTDLGETARIDNSADLTNVVARSWRAVTLVATQDTGTTADVNFNAGNQPLFGFVAQNADTNMIAEANFSVNVNASTTFANGSAFNASAGLTKVTFTVTGDSDGLDAANGSALLNVGGAAQTVAYTANNASSTWVFNATGAAINNTGATVFQFKLPTAATKSLGTSRTFGVKADVDPATANVPDQALAGNTSWWVWGANAIELRSAFFNNDSTGSSLTRFFFQNTGAAASYSAVCYGEEKFGERAGAGGVATTVTYGIKKTGTLNAGTTAIWADEICTFSGTSKRGSIVFTINSAASKVKGVYQQAINGAAAGYIPLERPYAGGTY